MPQVSQFWLDRLNGVPLGPAWATKDAQIALAGEVALDPDEAAALPLSTWAAMPRERRQAVETELYGSGVARADQRLSSDRQH